ncbi:serine-rich adhesin for platelets [Anopheles aquasalis]|uniref:serine-rich adhesin for platelets n=1 Tax=Anopheles aquasalis TaxID=42839 RepID=UPI00215A234A|nr:serine-rich adhesin for platelets [Anopheles aquasalis]XP_050088860.1 serine-rich adhesin for platelets [Anopheles aquasalis]
MPRIDPMKLLVCLSVLLAPNGGIRTSAEVKRLANLMAKFSKKLVSKCIYIQILKCTETELLGQFMQTGGWSLVHLWLVDGVTSKNWPLIQELLELLLCCPVDVERLKINTTPRLVKALSTDSAHERVRVLASKLVEQWLFIVKAPKQPSPSIPLNPSDVPLGDHSVIDGQPAILGSGVQEETNNNVGLLSEATPTGNADGSGCHLVNGIAGIATDGGSTEKDIGNKQGLRKREDDVDSAKKSFRAVVEQEPHKKTSLVLKITTKNGKQVVTEVRTPTSAMNGDDVLHRNGTQAEDDIEEEEEEDEEDEEVVVNIESEKPSNQGEDEVKDAKKHDLENGREGRERSGSVSSSSKDHRSHHSSRDREKDRKGSSNSGSRSSSSKSSSGSSSKSKSSSSSSSSKSSSSSSSRDKDKERHGSSSGSSSKHKSSSSSSSKSSGSGGSKSSRSSSDKHRDHKSSHSGGSSSSKDNKDSKSTVQSPSSGGSKSSIANLSRKSSKDDGGNDSGSETGSNSANNSSANTSGVGGSKKASISIEVRNPENRVKTVKTYNSQFRSHGLIEEAPPPPSRKGLKKPSSSTSSATAPTTGTGSAAVAGTKRLSPAPSSSPSSVRDAAGAPLEKRLKEDPAERPGAIKLIAPKRQHALVESDMFMDALSATLRKDVKKRKRRTSGSDSNSTTPTSPAPTVVGATKPAESAGVTAATKSSIPDSPTKKTAGSDGVAGGDASESIAAAASKETAPVTPPPIVAPMSFYRDTLAEDDEQSTVEGTDEDKKEDAASKEAGSKAKEDEEEDGDEAEAVTRKPKRVKCELNDDDDDDADEKENKADCKEGVKKDTATGGDEEEGMSKGGAEQSNALVDAMMNDVEMKMAAEEEESKEEPADGPESSDTEGGKKPPGPGCGPDGPPGVLVIHRRKGPKKQLRWRAAEDLEEIRYFELDVTERCNVTKSFTDMKNLERVDERQKFLLARKVGSEDNMTERTVWRPLVLVDNVPPAPDGNQSAERAVQHQRERSVLQALYFNKHMIPDCPVEPEPVDMYQTADPVHIPLEDVTGNPDSVNDFTSMPWPDPRSTPPHDSVAFNSPFFPADLPPGAGFGPGGFPPPFPGGMPGPAPWQMPGPPPGGRSAGGLPAAGGVLPPGMFPSLNQPPPGLGGGGAGGGGGNSPNMMLNLNLPPNVPPPGMFPGGGSFNSPPPDLGMLEGGGAGRRGGDGQNFRGGLAPPPWINNNRSFGGGGGGSGSSSTLPSQRGGHYGNRGASGGNWNNRSNNGGTNRGSAGERGRNSNSNSNSNSGAPWMQNNRSHSNRAGGGGGGGSSRKW